MSREGYASERGLANEQGAGSPPHRPPSLYKMGPGRAAAFEVLSRPVARLLLPALPARAMVSGVGAASQHRSAR